jgi:predicted nucleic acid-binding protein
MTHYNLEKVEKVHQSITSLENLTILPVNDKVTVKAIDFIRQGMQITDAFHAATMSVNHVETICSYDEGFDKAKGIKRQEP